MSIDRFAVNQYVQNSLIAAAFRDSRQDWDVHCHEFYEIELVVAGSGVYIIDGVSYNVQPGALFAMSPISFHEVHIMGESVRLMNLMFTQNACDDSYLTGIFSQKPYAAYLVGEHDMRFLELAAEELIAYLDTKQPEREKSPADHYTQTVLNCILGKICVLGDTMPYGGETAPLQTAMLYIQNNFAKPITLEEAARIAGYAPNYFSKQFKSYTGLSFKQYLCSIRFSYAEKLLKYSAMTIGQISAACGFGEYTNFTSEFKRKHKCTPGQYREACRVRR